jgi:hypothetical protein
MDDQGPPASSNALKRKISWSVDGDDIDDSDWRRPMRMEDIFPSRSPECCEKCKAMTGTPEGRPVNK